MASSIAREPDARSADVRQDDPTADLDLRARAADALPIFAFLWAFASLFHQAAYPSAAFGLSLFFIALPAIAVLLFPTSLPLLLVGISLQLLQVLRGGIANYSNHWVFTAAVNVALLAAVARLVLRNRSLRIHRGDLFLEFAPTARILLVVLYGFAVLHKLNRDFLSPATSCATDHYARISSFFSFLPQGGWVQWSVIALTLVVETAIPILLIVRRTRVAGIVVAAGFHFVLALNPAHVFFDFSSMLFAVFFLFVPFDFWRGLRSQRFRHPLLRSARERVTAAGVRRVARAVFGTLAVVLVVMYVMRLAPKTWAASNAMQEFVRALWIVYGGALLAIFLFVARRVRLGESTRALVSLRPRSPVYLIIPILLILNGLTPYLGYKTEASFAMFSNLRTEGDRWNHVFLPASMKIGGHQDDLVRLVDSNDPTLRLGARRDMLIPFWQLRLFGAIDPDLSVTYERGGTVHTVARAGGDPRLPPPSWIERHFMGFRMVDPPGRPVPCRH